MPAWLLKGSRRIRRLFGGDDAYALLLAALVGLTTGFGAVGFRKLVDSVTRLSFGGQSVLEQAAHLPWIWRLTMPVLGLCAAWALTRWLAKEAKGHGVPEVMEAVAQHEILVVGTRHHHGGCTVCAAPDPATPLEQGTVLVVEGPEDRLAWLRGLSRSKGYS